MLLALTSFAGRSPFISEHYHSHVSIFSKVTVQIKRHSLQRSVTGTRECYTPLSCFVVSLSVLAFSINGARLCAHRTSRFDRSSPQTQEHDSRPARARLCLRRRRIAIPKAFVSGIANGSHFCIKKGNIHWANEYFSSQHPVVISGYQRSRGTYCFHLRVATQKTRFHIETSVTS